MALGISLKDQQNFQPSDVTAVVPPVSTGEVALENVEAPFKGIASGAASLYESALTGATSAVTSILPSREQMFASGGMAPTMTALDPETIERNQALDSARVIDTLKPDPRKSGAAAQTLHGLTSGLTRFVAGTAAAGPVGGAVAVGASEGTNVRNEMIASGVDPDTAARLGLGSAVFSGAASLLPGGYGESLAARILSGSAAQVSLGAVQRGMMSNVLAQAGYTEQAKQYQPLDGASMMADAVLGAAFGAVHHVFAPDAVDSAHAMADTRQVERSAPGPAVDPVSRNNAVDAVERTMAGQVRGDDTPAPTADVHYAPDAAQDALREATGREATDAAAEVGAERVEPYAGPEMPPLPEGTGLEASPTSSLSRAGRAQARAKAEGEAVAQLDPTTAGVVQQALAIIKARDGATIPSAESPDKDIDAAGALKRALDDIKNTQGDTELHRVAAACEARA